MNLAVGGGGAVAVDRRRRPAPRRLERRVSVLGQILTPDLERNLNIRKILLKIHDISRDEVLRRDFVSLKAPFQCLVFTVFIRAF